MYQLAEWQALPDRDLLQSALAGNPYAAKVIESRLLPHLLILARKRAPNLPADLHEEIVQQAWLSVVSRSTDIWSSGQVDVRAYLAGVVRDAAKAVRANYRRPGQVSRFRRPSASSGPRQSAAPPLDNVPEKNLRRDGHLAIEARLELNSLYERASADVRVALGMICEEGATLEEAAAATGQTRRTLSRRIAVLRDAA